MSLGSLKPVLYKREACPRVPRGHIACMKSISVPDCIASLVPAPELKFSDLLPESITTASAHSSHDWLCKGAVLKQDRFISFCTNTIPKWQGNDTCLFWIIPHAIINAHCRLNSGNYIQKLPKEITLYGLYHDLFVSCLFYSLGPFFACTSNIRGTAHQVTLVNFQTQMSASLDTFYTCAKYHYLFSLLSIITFMGQITSMFCQLSIFHPAHLPVLFDQSLHSQLGTLTDITGRQRRIRFEMPFILRSERGTL